jgi:hypothetical protein
MDFWKGIYPEGMTANDVAKELHDFHFMIENAPMVYSHVTGGNCSKAMYHASTVMREADEYLESIVAEARADWEEEQESEFIDDNVSDERVNDKDNGSR